MKNIFIILIVFSCLLANAQFNKGTVFLKDSTELKGLIRIKAFGGIKFKPTKDSKSTFYDYNTITGFDTAGEKYRYIKYQDGFGPRLLKENIKGKISLYSNEVYNQGHTIPNGLAGGGVGMTFGGGSATIYFILVEGKLLRVGTRLKKKHLKILENCKSLTAKIKKKDFKKRDVYEIINYYNNSCD